MIPTFMGLNTMTLALAAQQASQNTTGHNMANANTDGYSRQRANLATTYPVTLYQGGGPLKVGTGVQVQSVTRARDSYIDMQYRQQNSSKSFWEDQASTFTQLEQIFHDGKVGTQVVGIQAGINNFWTSLGTLAADPTSVGARTNVREMANALVQTLKQDSDHLRALANDLTTQIATQVDNINNIAQQIASLNKQISAQESTGTIANDLRDQRDLLVDKLSDIANIQVYEDSSHNYQVQAGGVTLVLGDTAIPMTVTAERNTKYSFDTSTVIEANGLPGTIKFTSGKLASMIQMRDQTITGYLDSIDKMAQFLMQDFNNQHKQGLDNTTPAVPGTHGDNFFGVTGEDYTAYTPATCWLDELEVNKDFYTDTGLDKIAARDAGSAGLDEGTNAQRLADVLKKTPDPLPSPPNALGNLSLLDYYSTIIGTLGVQSQQASNMATNQGVLVSSTQNWRESISGVNMDEEMSNMIRFQKAYGAAANVVATMNSMLDTLINRMVG
ncbi:MAG TPA: flagellar hook-associated protein FlgK [Selenomonadales bacterium]|nr:flagellar hook-associated protein FlgK [Selenomonadales bacterium]